MRVPAREQLTIFWHGDEVAGIMLYGLCARRTWPDLDAPLEVWPPGTRVDEWRLHGERWEVVVWRLALSRWPVGNEWCRALQLTFNALISGGCRIVWLGRGEGFFCDPPDLFDPDCMSGGVLAALTVDGDLLCETTPDDPLEPLPDEELLRLRASAHGFADVP